MLLGCAAGCLGTGAVQNLTLLDESLELCIAPALNKFGQKDLAERKGGGMDLLARPGNSRAQGIEEAAHCREDQERGHMLNGCEIIAAEVKVGQSRGRTLTWEDRRGPEANACLYRSWRTHVSMSTSEGE